MASIDRLTTTVHKTYLTTANPFEQTFGYHRAVRRGPFITTSGTTALKLVQAASEAGSSNEATTVHFPSDAYKQTIHVLETCVAAVERLGGKKEDVIRVRMFVANSDDCGAVGNAFREIFGIRKDEKKDTFEQGEDAVATAATMIVVPGGFVDGEILVEIEMEAFVT